MAALQSVYSVYINFSTLQLALLLVFLSSSAQAETQPKLMLANTYHSNIELKDYWVSEKFDGVRAYWDGKTLLSRQGNVYHAPPWFTAQFPATPLDGELWLGRQRFDELSGAVRKDTPDESEWREIRFMVFDLPRAEGSFDQRLNKLKNIISQNQSPYLVLVAQQKFGDEKTLMAHLVALVAEGAEGLILHLGSAPYRSQRSDDLLKLKLYQDAEATVIGHIGGKGKYKGMLGSLLVETGDGIKFKIGSGFSDAQRQSPPAIGTTITYKYYGLTGSGTPRFASFLRIREE
ncbi:DNA ligase [Zhongshania marina]|uniref:DNA ligase n=1 Tax=Zhongshania marina TaxID=2304603 RepID=A0A2S4HK80_9GAMM|nr:DNA ligase [Marortus luteolus]POP54393.1 DNA ligase [Marortus luteolus]